MIIFSFDRNSDLILLVINSFGLFWSWVSEKGWAMFSNTYLIMLFTHNLKNYEIKVLYQVIL